jgi:MFS family permease
LLGSYRPLFTSARARRLVATSLSARLAVGMLGLPMILTVRDATGSYAAAGLVSGAWSVGVAVSSPLRGRLVDRRGSRRALPPLALVSAGALAVEAYTWLSTANAIGIAVGSTAAGALVEASGPSLAFLAGCAATAAAAFLIARRSTID